MAIDELRHRCSAESQRSLENLQYEMHRSSKDWGSSVAMLEKWIAEHAETVKDARQLVCTGFPLGTTRDEIVAFARKVKLPPGACVCAVGAEPRSAIN